MTAIPMRAEAEVVTDAAAGDLRIHSVTTILKNIGSDDGLIFWAADLTAKAAVKNKKTWEAMVEDEGPQAAIEWLREARFRPPRGERTATNLGSAVHAACELYTVHGKRPAMGTRLGEFGVMDKEVEPFIDSFDLFLDKFQPEFQAAEFTVFDTRYGFAGTADGIAKVQGVPVIFDYKTSKDSYTAGGNRKRPREPVAMQLSAYSHAEIAAVWRARRFQKPSSRYYLLSEEEKALGIPVPKVEGGIAVHLTPLHADVYPVLIDDEIFESFLYAMEAARWEYDVSKKALGAPLALLDKKS